MSNPANRLSLTQAAAARSRDGRVNLTFTGRIMAIVRFGSPRDKWSQVASAFQIGDGAQNLPQNDRSVLSCTRGGERAGPWAPASTVGLVVNLKGRAGGGSGLTVRPSAWPACPEPRGCRWREGTSASCRARLPRPHGTHLNQVDKAGSLAAARSIGHTSIPEYGLKGMMVHPPQLIYFAPLAACAWPQS
jgi:hypothetical protein